MKNYKIERAKWNDLDTIISKYENDGYAVIGFTWVECDLEFVLIFYKLAEVNSKELTKEILKKINEKPLDEDNPYKPYRNPYNPYIEPIIPPNKKPWDDYPPLKYPYNPNQPWRIPDIVWCCDNKPKPTYSTHTYPNNFSSTTGDVKYC